MKNRSWLCFKLISHSNFLMWALSESCDTCHMTAFNLQMKVQPIGKLQLSFLFIRGFLIRFRAFKIPHFTCFLQKCFDDWCSSLNEIIHISLLLLARLLIISILSKLPVVEINIRWTLIVSLVDSNIISENFLINVVFIRLNLNIENLVCLDLIEKQICFCLRLEWKLVI